MGHFSNFVWCRVEGGKGKVFKGEERGRVQRYLSNKIGKCHISRTIRGGFSLAIKERQDVSTCHYDIIILRTLMVI